jgi:hypothetical protein
MWNFLKAQITLFIRDFKDSMNDPENKAPNASILPHTVTSTQVPSSIVEPVLSQNTAPQTPIKVTLTQICTAMRDFEGSPHNPKTGQPDPNYRNNNPLNCKFYYGGYLPIYEPVKISRAGFAIFKDYATGWLYGFNEIKNKITHHPTWTLLDMISDHAPSSENDPAHYTEIVAKEVGVDIHYPVKNIMLI